MSSWVSSPRRPRSVGSSFTRIPNKAVPPHDAIRLRVTPGWVLADGRYPGLPLLVAGNDPDNRLDNRVQVVASAGSGKTSVMVARAAYAVMRGFVPPDGPGHCPAARTAARGGRAGSCMAAAATGTIAGTAALNGRTNRIGVPLIWVSSPLQADR